MRDRVPAAVLELEDFNLKVRSSAFIASIEALLSLDRKLDLLRCKESGAAFSHRPSALSKIKRLRCLLRSALTCTNR